MNLIRFYVKMYQTRNIQPQNKIGIKRKHRAIPSPEEHIPIVYSEYQRNLQWTFLGVDPEAWTVIAVEEDRGKIIT